MITELYSFTKLNEKLNEIGYPEVLVSKSGFRLMRMDFSQESFINALKEGKVRYGKNGIYLSSGGKEWKGYMYMPTYRIEHYNDKPKFHLTRCKTIEDFFSLGRGYLYKWSNNKMNDIIDRDTSEIHKNIVLDLCYNCQRIISDKINDTKEFYETLEINDTEEFQEVSTDINGYTFNWEEISRAYKIEKEYTCEKCGIKIINKLDQRFIHTHHKNGSKINNKKENLECLCVLCHAHTNEFHEQNFEIKTMQIQKNSFVNKYKKQLKELGNKFI